MPYIAFVSHDDASSNEERRDRRDRLDDIVHLLRSPTRENRVEAAGLVRIEDYVVQASVSEEATFTDVVIWTQNRPGLESWSRTPGPLLTLIGDPTVLIDGQEYGRRSLSPGDAILMEDGQLLISNGRTFVEVPTDRAAAMRMRTEDARTVGDLFDLAPAP